MEGRAAKRFGVGLEMWPEFKFRASEVDTALCGICVYKAMTLDPKDVTVTKQFDEEPLACLGEGRRYDNVEAALKILIASILYKYMRSTSILSLTPTRQVSSYPLTFVLR